MMRFAQTRRQMTLGQLIDRLNAVLDKSQHVRYDFGHFYPTKPESYRGSYAELAIGWELVSFENQGPTTDAFLSDLRDAVGRTYQGYKGGDFTMQRETPLWVAEWGHSGWTAVVDVLQPSEYEVVLLTEYCEF